MNDQSTAVLDNYETDESSAPESLDLRGELALRSLEAVILEAG